jgi:hypothetical protein
MVQLPIPEEYQETLAPILDHTPAAEVTIEEDKISIKIPISGEFSKDYVTPPPDGNGERFVFRTRLYGKGKRRIHN